MLRKHPAARRSSIGLANNPVLSEGCTYVEACDGVHELALGLVLQLLEGLVLVCRGGVGCVLQGCLLLPEQLLRLLEQGLTLRLSPGLPVRSIGTSNTVC